MVAVVERDRRVARRLVAALEARGCRVRLAHGYAQARMLLDGEVPAALYVSEALHRASGGDLLADLDADHRFAALPGVVRVSRDDSVFARAMRRGGLQTVVAPIDVDATAALLARMARGEEGTLRRLLHHARELHARTRDNRKRTDAMREQTRRNRASLRHRP